MNRFYLKETDPATVTQWAYIAEAATEYFVSITTTGAFFTLLVKQLGVSDAMAGILSSIAAIAYLFQLFAAVFVSRWRSIRKTVLIMNTLQQLLSSAMYLLPFMPLSSGGKVGLFALLYLVSLAFSNLILPTKFSWMMSFVQPQNKGSFTASKEMVSLITGLVYNFGMSRLVDHFNAAGKQHISLILCAAVIFAVTVLHVISLLVAHDAPAVLEDVRKTPSFVGSLRTNFGNKNFRKILVISGGWGLFANICNPYQSVYLLQDLGQSMTFISAAFIVYSVLRFFVSKPLGRLADKHGFDKAVEWGFAVFGIGCFMFAFWVPANGAVLYMLYQIPYAISMALLSGGLYNILYQYIPPKDRVSALGLYWTVCGVIGFVGALIGGWILDAVQAVGNQLFGITIYGQQIQHAIVALGMLGMVIYDRLVVEKMERVE